MSLGGSHPGELSHVLHHLEVGLHLVRQPGHVAELGDQGDGLGDLLFLLGLPLGKRCCNDVERNVKTNGITFALVISSGCLRFLISML